MDGLFMYVPHFNAFPWSAEDAIASYIDNLYLIVPKLDWEHKRGVDISTPERRGKAIQLLKPESFHF